MVMVGIMFCWPAYGETPASRAERRLFAAVNRARQSEGLAPLRWDYSLAAAARRHARVMAVRGTAQHFSSLAENVTQGPTPGFIHSQFMKSTPHRANILDRDMNSIGVGVVEQRGRLFAVEDFSRAW
jgi:uncharacterized protein YkwD